MDAIPGTRRRSSRRPVVALFACSAVVVAALAAVSAWQANQHDSKLDEAASHTATVAIINQAGQEGGAAASLLEEYVKTGDETLPPQVKSHAEGAIGGLSSAVSRGSVADFTTITTEGARLAQGAGAVVALRQSGDLKAAAAAMAELGAAFDALGEQFRGAVALELEQVSTLESSAAQADERASWFLIATLAFGGAWALSLTMVIGRALRSRRRSENPSSF